MAFIQNALAGNPFSTVVGSKIEQATDGTLASENWALNMEICDIINETDDGPRDAVKAIRRRLNQNAGKNYTVVMYTLTILETCVKNCSKRFHVLVCNKDFVQELVKILNPKNDPPTAVQDKVLSLIQSWASAFRSDQDLSGVTTVYEELRAKGIEFPSTDLDSMAPIHTPQKSVRVQPSANHPSNVAMTSPSRTPSHSIQLAPPQSPANSSNGRSSANPDGTLTIEQRAKLQSELDVVQSNIIVFGEMLSEIKPGDEQPDELELLSELNSVCQNMQQRLMELISQITNDSLTEELLRINDDMNNLFLRYSRWEKNRAPHSTLDMVNKAIPPPSGSSIKLKESEDNLINLSDSTSKLAIEEPAKNNIGKSPDEFDMFAQSRNVNYENSKTSGSSYKDNLNPNQIAGGLSTVTQGKPLTDEDRELNEMANWLGKTGGVEESVTSSDFERFLAERAAAADSLPTVSATTGSNNPSSLKKKAAEPLADDLLA